MSVSAAIQRLIIAKLKAAPSLSGVSLHDYRPPKDGYPAITLGPSDAVLDEAECLRLRTETVQVDCWTRDEHGTRSVRELADKVAAALHRAEGELSTGALVQMRVIGTRAFRDPDGETGHGVVTVEVDAED